MKNLFSTSLLMLVFSSILLLSCTDNELVPGNSDPFEPEKDVEFPFKFSEIDYTTDNTYYLLNDNEPSEIYFNQAERSFKVNEPLQISMTDDHYFQFRFYSPRAITDLIVWARIEGYDEEFRFAEFSKIMPLQQFRIHIPFATEDITAYTRSGKRIKIMRNPHLSSTNISFEIECNNPVYKMMTGVKPRWKIYFGNYQGGNWLSMKPVHTREAVAMALNMAAMYSTTEFEQQLEEKRGTFIESGNKVDIDELKRRIMNLSGLRFGLVDGNVTGLGGGETFGLVEYAYLTMYADDSGPVTTPFHELAHCLGYSHNGNMTYGDGWTPFCQELFVELGRQKKLPVYSRRFLHSRKTLGGNPYATSRFPFENDPELDALDGGLSPLKGESDTGGNDGTELSLKLDYTAVPGATASTFIPKDVYVYGNEMYVANEANGNFSIEVFEISNENVKHIHTIKEWQGKEGMETFAKAPNGIVRANGKLYVTHEGNRTEIFDASTYQFINHIGNGNWGTGGNQTVHAYDVTVARGLVLIRDKRYVDVVEESMVQSGNTMYVYARSENLDERNGTFGMAVDEQNGLLYVTHWSSKRIDVLNLADVREGVTWKRSSNFSYKNSPYSLDFYEGDLFVSSNGAEKFCKVNPRTGEIIKDYTTVGEITLSSPEKFCIRRNTLFIVERAAGRQCVYAIPMSRLK